MIDMHDYTPAGRRLWWAMVMAGGLVVAGSLMDAGLHWNVDAIWRTGLLLIGTAVVAWFPVTIRTNRFGYSGADLLAYVALFLVGPGPAILVAATEGFVGAKRMSKRMTSHLSSPAVSALAMGVTAFVVKAAGVGDPSAIGSMLAGAVVAGLVTFVVARELVGTLLAVKSRKALTPIAWLTGQAWMGATYLTSSVIAAVLAIGAQAAGPLVFAAAVPLLAMSVVALHSHQKMREADRRADELLANIFPERVLEALKAKGRVEPERHDEVSILFSDFADFTTIAATMPAEKLVAELNEIFTAFDEIAARHGLEKVKTIGDAYLGGCGFRRERDHAALAMRTAIEMRRWLERRNETAFVKWPIRIGIHSGPVVSGVVGQSRYAYDIWGDTVNIAARLQAAGESGQITVSAYTASLAGDDVRLEYIGKLQAKGKGPIDMYVVGAAVDGAVLVQEEATAQLIDS